MDAAPADFGPSRNEEEQAQAEDILTQAFAMTPPGAREWIHRAEAGGARLMLLREQGGVVATAALIPMGQWWGGRSVPMEGVAAVGVAPARRGLGTGSRLMRACLHDAHSRGAMLSALYPSTQPLYRGVGFEQAGSRFEHRVPLATLDFKTRTPALRPVRPEDLPALHAVYLRHARQRSGCLDRGPYLWNRILSPRGETTSGYLVEGDSGVEGYVFLSRRPLSAHGHKHELSVLELVALTPDAGRRLLSFLGDHGSLAPDVLLRGGATDPLLFLLREQTHQTRLLDHWMMRVLDVAGALQARGYPSSLSAALHLEVEDEFFPENQGRFVLEVERGEPQVRTGGQGDLKLHVRALAPLYTGFLSPAALQLAGALRADDASLATAQSLFAGPAPAMTDMF